MKKMILWAVFILAIGFAAAVYYQSLEEQRNAEQAPQLDVPPPGSGADPESPPEPQIRYPIPEPSAPVTVDEMPAQPVLEQPIQETVIEPLPELNQSDPVITDALSGLLGTEVQGLFNLDEIIRRYVVTIDNLPQKKLPRQNVLAKRVSGPFLVAGEADTWVISPDNAARYAPYVNLATSVDTEQLVALYVRFYPLFQEAFAELGYPNAYFNDRLVEVIDHLLETPTVDEPIRLVRPHVFYQYADPELEALSAGQKILVRMGNANAEQVKTMLRNVRKALTRQAPDA